MTKNLDAPSEQAEDRHETPHVRVESGLLAPSPYRERGLDCDGPEASSNSAWMWHYNHLVDEDPVRKDGAFSISWTGEL